ncbi:hypothetical protein IF1G_04283 [Cordyceps javanica]|uniref:Secreted protein n=1 Tax=Cordyceps javanica TaxID=43265 RepID=A0A545V5Q5_9HYPO|nr:hypothetical protein IF1G_04283 [Cordyceps javanica]
MFPIHPSSTPATPAATLASILVLLSSFQALFSLFDSCPGPCGCGVAPALGVLLHDYLLPLSVHSDPVPLHPPSKVSRFSPQGRAYLFAC